MHLDFTFVDLFAGMGGFRIPLEALGGRCLGYSEINRTAISTYRKNFLNWARSGEISLGDITQYEFLPFTEIDILTGGVPCQPWSIAGKLGGFDDARGQLWTDVLRIVANNRPKGFIFENVKGLAEPRNAQSLQTILNGLKSSGYAVQHRVLTSRDFGSPQDRKRIYIVGVRNDISNSFEFPESSSHRVRVCDVITGLDTGAIAPKEGVDFFLLSDVRGGRTTIHSWDLVSTTPREKAICMAILQHRRRRVYGDRDGNPLCASAIASFVPSLVPSELDVLVFKGILRVVAGMKYEFANSRIAWGINGVYRIYLPHATAISTLTATGSTDFVATASIEGSDPATLKQRFIEEIYIPRQFKALTARDYARLQGFPDSYVLPNTETAAKRLLGNAVSIPVIEAIAQKLLNAIY